MFGRPQQDKARRHGEGNQPADFLQAIEMIVTRRHKTSKTGVAKLEVR